MNRLPPKANITAVTTQVADITPVAPTIQGVGIIPVTIIIATPLVEKVALRKRKMEQEEKILRYIALGDFILILALLTTFGVMHYLGKKSLLGNEAVALTLPEDINYDDIEGDGKTIEYKGHTYEFNSNIASILFMGVDHDEFKDDAVPSTTRTGRCPVSYDL